MQLCPQRAGPGAGAQALFDELDELTREPFRAAKAGDRRQAGQATAASRSTSCGPGTTTTRSSRKRRPSSAVDLDVAVLRTVDILEDLPRVLRGHRAADRRRARTQRPLREAGQEPARLLHRHRPRGRRPRAGQHRARTTTGWARCCTSWATRSTAARTFPGELPYVLRTRRPHPLTTEGVAMMFERLAERRGWLEAMGVQRRRPGGVRRGRPTDAAQSAADLLALVPGDAPLREGACTPTPSQDLNKLWWDLVEKYQRLKRPEGRERARLRQQDPHRHRAPAYYHNYMMGELFAWQVHAAIADEVLGRTTRPRRSTWDPRVGQFMRQRVFAPGRTLPWNDLTRFATGQPLNPEAFAAELRRSEHSATRGRTHLHGGKYDLSVVVQASRLPGLGRAKAVSIREQAGS